MASTFARFFHDRTIGTKIAAVVAIPILSLVILLSSSLPSSWKAAEQADGVARVASVVASFGETAHELQKERGASAVFVGAKGARFGSEMTAQRQVTDKTLDGFKAGMQALEQIKLAGSLRVLRPDVDKALAEIIATRARVDKLDIAAPDMAARYAAAIGQIVRMLGETQKLADDARINMAARAYILVLEGKERAGQERAMGASSFAAGRFEQKIFDVFVGLFTLQNALFADFRLIATPELTSALDAVLASAESRDVERMRAVGQAAPFGGDLSSVTGPAWFGATTARINLLKTVEDKASQHLAATARVAADVAARSLYIDAAIGLIALLGSLAAAFVIARGITRPLASISGTMLVLAKGESVPEIEGAGRKDEIGAMASALSVFRDNLVRMRDLEQEERAQSRARAARADAMASVVSDVGEVVAAAASGDFSARLSIEDGDEQMQKLVAGINEINAVVDSATTEFAQILQAIAGGDLTQSVATSYRGRFADLKDAINETVERLSSTVRTIQLTSSDVGLAAGEISTGADDLSKRTEEQASSLEETAATTEELAASVKASAQGARQAAAIAGEAMRAAESGGAIAGEAVAAMARIEDASKKISDIIRVIDDIAFQTNLLALNAAVEAARAGDAGKGFAVVASEVRTLAQRSSEAAKDISGLISSSNIEVEAGVKLVRRAGDSLGTILSASQKVAATIQEISAASAEQANGIDEMSQTVAHLDEMTQANAALAEQSAASAGALSDKIGELNALVSAFRTGAESTLAAAARPAPPRRAPLAPANDSEPERLRRLAEAAFAQNQAAPRRERPAVAPAPPPARKVANARAGDAGWEEF